jgi:hypothetical protein
MKCDLRLPKCGSCLHAGVECLTVDPGLEENVPRRHVHGLALAKNRVKLLTSACACLVTYILFSNELRN